MMQIFLLRTQVSSHQYHFCPKQSKENDGTEKDQVFGVDHTPDNALVVA
jgi:hypothetical protein